MISIHDLLSGEIAGQTNLENNFKISSALPLVLLAAVNMNNMNRQQPKRLVHQNLVNTGALSECGFGKAFNRHLMVSGLLVIRTV